MHKQVGIQIRKLYFDLVHFKVQSYWKIPFWKIEIHCTTLLARTNMDLNVHHEMQSKTQIKVKEHGFYFYCFTFHSHSRIFKNEHKSYYRMSVKRSLACSCPVLFTFARWTERFIISLLFLCYLVNRILFPWWCVFINKKI